MPSLGDVQAAMAGALLSSARAGDLGAMILADGIAAEARLAIYRHHVFASLTGALRSTYPVIGQLVGDGFFGYAAHEFIVNEPPSGPCLFEYGGGFAHFLETFPPCRHLPYLGDVARLEWALNHALHAEEAVPLDLDALRSLGPEQIADLTFGFDPSVTLLTSPWSVDEIWRANQPGADPAAIVDATTGPVRLEIRRRGDDVVVRALAPATYTFRRSLLDGHTLARAADQAVRAAARRGAGPPPCEASIRTAVRAAARRGAGAPPCEASIWTADPFDIAAALQELFTDDVLASFRVASRSEEIS